MNVNSLFLQCQTCLCRYFPISYSMHPESRSALFHSNQTPLKSLWITARRCMAYMHLRRSRQR
ncbi:hypothetical protein BDQ17DRAFT_1363440 [Cyathus striatus]|nr:hypothetical protein BDQ17DRAFT_1363440 [Cyathus striatus]